jgi:hypothetical protein
MIFNFKSAERRLAEIYGDGDTPEVFKLISDRIPQLFAPGSMSDTDLLDEIQNLIAQHPEAHNLRVAVIAGLRDRQLHHVREGLRAASLLRFPRSPILSKQLLKDRSLLVCEGDRAFLEAHACADPAAGVLGKWDGEKFVL